MLEQAGIEIVGGSSEMLIFGNTNTTALGDAYALCTTVRFAPEKMKVFGEFCVQISDVRQLFRLVSAAVAGEHTIIGADHRRVTYASREYADTEVAAGPLGFVKPPDEYAEQQEYRFLWQPADWRTLQPRLFNCPGVRPLVRQVLANGDVVP
jgi:hypothetical protein